MAEQMVRLNGLERADAGYLWWFENMPATFRGAKGQIWFVQPSLLQSGTQILIWTESEHYLLARHEITISKRNLS